MNWKDSEVSRLGIRKLLSSNLRVSAEKSREMHNSA
jgi:hypothetical protein